MKNFFLLILLIVSLSAGAQVGIGTTTPNASSQLDLTSTTKGMLVPRMTAAQKTAIASPATGLMIFQTDGTPGFYYYSGSAWTLINAGVTAVANGGTGSATQNFVDLTTTQTVAGAKTFSNAATFSSTVNGLTLTPLATGFTIAGGTTSKTLTVPLAASVSGTNTGDQTITLTGDVTGTGTGSFATAIGASKVTNAMLAGSIDLTSKVTGILPVANGGTGSATQNYVDLTTTQTVAGAKTLTGNTTVSGSLTGGNSATSTLAGFSANLNAQTAATYTLVSTDNGKIITINNATGTTVTVPSTLPAGFNCLIVQTGAGQVTLTGSGVTINNRSSYTKTAGLYAIATLVALTSTSFVSSGDMN